MEKKTQKIVKILRSHAKMHNKRAIEYIYMDGSKIPCRTIAKHFKEHFIKIVDEEMVEVLYGRETV